MAKAIRYFFMQEYYPTVIDSQVINWLEITNDLFRQNNIVSVLSSSTKKIDSSKVSEIESRINGRYYQLILSKLPIFRDIQLLIFVLNIYLSQVKKSIVVMQSRFLLFYMVAPVIHWLPRLKLVYEARGSALAEFHYTEAKTNGSANKARYVRFRENAVLTYSHLIICVSHKQREFLISEYDNVISSKFIVIPGVADSNLFYYSDKLMCSMKNELGIEDKIVFLYSGRLYRQWQQPEAVFKTLKFIYDGVPNSYFILLTPDQELAKGFFEHYHIPDKSYLITYADMRQINSFLNAADYGLLFRENLPINNQASPTKFCEYILAGLKVLISEGVGDFSQFVSENNSGQVLRLIDGMFKVDLSTLVKQESQERIRISEIGKKHLSKQGYLDRVRSAYSRLLSYI